MRLGLLTAGLVACAAPAFAADDPLAFDPAAFTTVNIMLDGQPATVRRYRAVYVARPTAIDISKTPSMGGPPPGMGPPPGAGPTTNATAPLNGVGPMGAGPTDPLAYQTLYIYVPQQSVADAKTAIVLQVNNGGWMASPARDIVREGGRFVSDSDTDNTGAALKAGYIVVSAGTRGRGLQGPDASYPGKAPAVIVDAKAAIRYLRHNDAVMPGSAERIVITGTSGGGGLSVAVAASGGSADYAPELAAIGAAGMDAQGKSTLRDDVFATIAYCPINDLGNADTAYEWQYGAVRTAANTAAGRYAAANQAASATLAAQYPAALAALGLRGAGGAPLTAQTMPQAILDLVRASAQDALSRGVKVPAFGEDFEIARRGPPGQAGGAPLRLRNDWLTVENGQVKSIDYTAFLKFVAATQALKGVPAFDATASTGNAGVTGENTLFGPAGVPYANFTAYGWNHNEVRGDGSGADDTGLTFAGYTAGPGAGLARQLRLASPMAYLGERKTTVAPYWYVRHGLIDRDIAFASQAALAAAVRGAPAVKNLDFKIAWMQPHAGNYDVREAYAWLAGALAKAGAPGR